MSRQTLFIMRRTGGIALRAGVYAIAGVIAVYALKEVMLKLHDICDSLDSNPGDDDDDRPDMALNDLDAKRALADPKSESSIQRQTRVSDVAHDHTTEVAPHTAQNEPEITLTQPRDCTTPGASSKSACLGANGDLTPPITSTGPQMLALQDVPILLTKSISSSAATFHSHDTSPGPSLKPPPDGVANPLYNLTNTPSLPGPQTGPATLAHPHPGSKQVLPPLSMPSEAHPSSSESSPTDFFSPASSPDMFFSPLSPSQTWLRMEPGDGDEPMEGRSPQTAYESEPTSLGDYASSFTMELAAARRRILAHDVFATSYISFAELGNLVASESAVHHEDPGDVGAE